LIEIDYLKYVLKAEIKTRSKANKVLEPNSSKDTEPKNAKNQSAKNQNIENQKQRGEIEDLELISSKSSATFKDKFKTKLRSAFVNLLSEIEMLFPKLWKEEHLRRVFYGCSQRMSV
jgi:hypothetical protein